MKNKKAILTVILLILVMFTAVSFLLARHCHNIVRGITPRLEAAVTMSAQIGNTAENAGNAVRDMNAAGRDLASAAGIIARLAGNTAAALKDVFENLIDALIDEIDNAGRAEKIPV